MVGLVVSWVLLDHMEEVTVALNDLRLLKGYGFSAVMFAWQMTLLLDVG